LEDEELEMSDETELTFAAGTILHLEQGEYSDRCIAGLLVCLSDLNLTKLAHEWFEKKAQLEAAKAKETAGYWAWLEPSAFVGWLCAEQHCASLSHEYVHIASYGELEFLGVAYSSETFERRVDEINGNTPESGERDAE
jgi:hypothetical protein